MTKRPSFPFYPKQLLGDKDVALMTHAELGAHTLLLCYAWEEDPPGSLPDDDNVLAKLARTDEKTWKQLREGVLRGWKLRKKRFYNDGLVRAHEQSNKKQGQTRRAAYSRWDADAHADAYKESCDSVTVSSSLRERERELLLLRFASLQEIKPVYSVLTKEDVLTLSDEFPTIPAHVVMGDLLAWEQDRNRGTKSPRARMRNFFKQDRKSVV